MDHTKYTEGANIVPKFQHRLNPTIQNYIACLTFGWPSDDVPNDWYDAAILCDENHIVNSAFQSTLQSTWTTLTAGAGAGTHHSQVARIAKPADAAPVQTTAVTPFTGITTKSTQDPNVQVG